MRLRHVLAVAVLVSCGRGVPDGLDAGPVDLADASTAPDASGVDDAGADGDAGTSDDAGTSGDAGTAGDAGAPVDAGATDASVTDGGAPTGDGGQQEELARVSAGHEGAVAPPW